MSERSEDLDIGFSAIFKSLLKDIHTAMPGKVVSFDKTKQTISVQPVLKRLYADSEDSENLPIIEDVPVSFPGSGDFWLTFDIKKDSYVLLIFAERSIANWLVQGGIVDPKLNQTFDLSDAIAIAGINPFPDFIPQGFTSNGMTITSRDGQTQIDIKAGNIDIKATNITLNDPTATDFAIAFNRMKAAFDQLKSDFNSHTHITTATIDAGPVGVVNPTVPGSSADMTSAKVDGVKVP